MTESTPVSLEAPESLEVFENPDVVEATDTPEAAAEDAPVADAPPEVSEDAEGDADDADDAEGDTDSDDDTDSADEDEDDADDSGDTAEDDSEGSSDDDDDDRPASRLEAEGDIAADYLEELLDIADLDGDIDTYVEGGRAQVSIVTEGDQLVGKNGEVLDALQELARLAVMTETDHRSRLMLDIAGHRDRRRAELTVLAKDAIAEVKQSGEAARLAPMNPFERKIIHDIVAAADLVSESEGVEPKRRVVILP